MAKIFRLQENVPDVYPRKSRDFQLLCNLFDILQGGIKYDIDTITSVTSTRYCSERLLPLLQTKLGFWTQKQFNATELRSVLTSFQDVVRDKGSIKGIREAIELYLKIVGASRKSRIQITNAVESESTENVILHNSSYNVHIMLEGAILDLTLLTEILRYVIPAGYRLKYSFYRALQTTEYIVEKGTINIIVVSSAVNNRVVSKDANQIDTKLLRYVFAEGKLNPDAEYFSKDGNVYTSITGQQIINTHGGLNTPSEQLPTESPLQRIIDFTLISKGTEYTGPKSTIHANRESVTKAYILLREVEETQSEPQGTSLVRVYNAYNSKYYDAIDLSVVDYRYYIYGLPYCKQTKTQPGPEGPLTVEPATLNYMEGLIDAPSEGSYMYPRITLGRDDSAKQSYFDLMSSGAIACIFNKSASTRVLIEEQDAFGSSVLRYVNEGELYVPHSKYYTNSASLTDYNIEDVSSYEDNPGKHYLLSRSSNTLLNSEFGCLKCVWNVDNDPRVTDSSELYYIANTTDEYVFNPEGKVRYYINDDSAVLTPGQINTSFVADVENNVVFVDNENNDKFSTNPEEGYVLKYLNGDLNSNE